MMQRSHSVSITEPGKSQLSTFSGSGYRLSDAGSSKLIPQKNMLPKDAVMITDRSIPDQIPSVKTTFLKNWEWTHKGHENDYQLGKINLSDMVKHGLWTTDALNHSEIHVLWSPHLPVNNYISTNVEASLVFSKTEDPEEGEIARCMFPSPLHAHMIFYPGHSCNVGRGKVLPWTLSFNIRGTNISEDYVAADVYTKLVGYHMPVSTHTEKRGVDLISMIPIEEEFSGITWTRPRIPGADWKIGTYKLGTKSTKDNSTLLKLTQYGVNVEGLQMLGKLSAVLKDLRGIKMDDTIEVRKIVLSTAIKHMKNN